MRLNTINNFSLKKNLNTNLKKKDLMSNNFFTVNKITKIIKDTK